MLGMDLFRNEADKIRADHDKRGLPHERINQVIELDEQWRDAPVSYTHLTLPTIYSV